MDDSRAPGVHPGISALAADVRYAWRFLRRQAGFTTVAAATLALGIGMSAAIFSAEYAIALRPFPYTRADRIVRIAAVSPESTGNGRAGVNPSFAGSILATPRLFQSVGASLAVMVTTHAASAPDLVKGEWVSGGFFAVYGVAPMLGRTIRESDTTPGAERVVVLSHSLWRQMFGGTPDVVGRIVDLTVSPAFMFTPFAQPTQPYVVIGVMPPADRFPSDDALWVPLERWASDPRMKGMGGPPNLQGNVTVTGRLRDDDDLLHARADVRSLAEAWRHENPGGDETWRIEIVSLRDATRPEYATAVLLLGVAVDAVLLLACVSVGGMLAARTRARRAEMAIREALGAGRRRLVQQVLVESAMIAAAGGAGGLAVAVAAERVLRALAPPAMTPLRSLSIDVPVLAYAALLCTMGGVAIGTLPALVLWRTRRATTIRLAHGVHAAAGRGRRSRQWLIATQIALVVPIVAGAMLAVRSFDRLIHVPVGYARDHVLVMSLKLSASACAPRRFGDCLNTIREIVGRAAGLPGAAAAAISNTRPFEIPMTTRVITDAPAGADARSEQAQSFGVTPDYFRTLTIPLHDGRLFADRDGADAPAVAIVNESFARQVLGGRAVGRKIRLTASDSWIDIVGEVADTNDRRLSAPPMPAFYVPLSQARFVAWTTLLVRTTIDPLRLSAPARAVVAAVDPGAPVTNVSTLDRDISQSAAEPRLNTTLLSTFAAFGLIVSLLGIYGLVAFAVGERHREFGVRRAVGATSLDLVRLVFSEGLVSVGGGLGAGLALALAVCRWFQSQLFEVSPTDPATLTGVALLIVAVAALAYGLPARHAALVDPVVVLRHE